MKVLKTLALILGLLMILMGGLGIGQGLNIIRWPAESFMIELTSSTLSEFMSDRRSCR